MKAMPTSAARAVAAGSALLAVGGLAAAPAMASPQDAQTARAIACEQYAPGASTFDYRNLDPWTARLTRRTSPELRAKLITTVGSLRKQLQPLKWVSTGKLAGAEVTDAGNGFWRAKCFVSVHATNVQAPGGRDVLTAYVITLDKNRGWQIVDVEGAKPAR